MSAIEELIKVLPKSRTYVDKSVTTTYVGPHDMLIKRAEAELAQLQAIKEAASWLIFDELYHYLPKAAEVNLDALHALAAALEGKS